MILKHLFRDFMIEVAMMCKSGTKIYTIKCNAEHNPCDGARLIRWPINSWKKL